MSVDANRISCVASVCASSTYVATALTVGWSGADVIITAGMHTHANLRLKHTWAVCMAVRLCFGG